MWDRLLINFDQTTQNWAPDCPSSLAHPESVRTHPNFYRSLGQGSQKFVFTPPPNFSELSPRVLRSSLFPPTPNFSEPWTKLLRSLENAFSPKYHVFCSNTKLLRSLGQGSQKFPFPTPPNFSEPWTRVLRSFVLPQNPNFSELWLNFYTNCVWGSYGPNLSKCSKAWGSPPRHNNVHMVHQSFN